MFLESTNVRKQYNPLYKEEKKKKLLQWLHFECILPNSQMIARPEKIHTINYNELSDNSIKLTGKCSKLPTKSSASCRNQITFT